MKSEESFESILDKRLWVQEQRFNATLEKVSDRLCGKIDELDKRLDSVDKVVTEHEQNFKLFGNVLGFTGMSGIAAIFIGVYNCITGLFKQ